MKSGISKVRFDFFVFAVSFKTYLEFLSTIFTWLIVIVLFLKSMFSHFSPHISDNLIPIHKLSARKPLPFKGAEESPSSLSINCCLVDDAALGTCVPPTTAHSIAVSPLCAEVISTSPMLSVGLHVYSTVPTLQDSLTIYLRAADLWSIHG